MSISSVKQLWGCFWRFERNCDGGIRRIRVNSAMSAKKNNDGTNLPLPRYRINLHGPGAR